MFHASLSSRDQRQTLASRQQAGPPRHRGDPFPLRDRPDGDDDAKGASPASQGGRRNGPTDQNIPPRIAEAVAGDPETTGIPGTGSRNAQTLPRWWCGPLTPSTSGRLNLHRIPLILALAHGPTGHARFASALDPGPNVAPSSSVSDEIERRAAPVPTRWTGPHHYRSRTPSQQNYATQGGAALFATGCPQGHGPARPGCRPRAIRTCWMDDGLGPVPIGISTTHAHRIRNEEELTTRYPN